MFDRRTITHPRNGERLPPLRKQVDERHELALLALVLARSRRNALKGLEALPSLEGEASEETREQIDLALRSAVGATPIGESPVTESMAERLFGQLEAHSAFARLLPFMAPAILRTKFGVLAQSITTAATGETTYKRLTALELEAAALVPAKATGLAVVTAEMYEGALADGARVLNDLLLLSLASGLDAIFLAAIAGTPVASSGSPLADVRALLGAVDRHGGEQLALVMHPSTCAVLATMPDSDGGQRFPSMTPAGGTLAGLPAIPSNAVPVASSGSQLLLVDASMLAAALGPPRFDVSTTADVRMVDDQGLSGAANLVSLWQTNSVAALIERAIAVVPLRASAVAVVDDVDYAAAS